MNESTQPLRPVVTHELDPVAVERELETFRPVLLSPITKVSLDSWTTTSAIRADILANTMWGTIRWRKSLGLPLVPVLANAFVIEQLIWQEVLVIENGVGRWKTLIVPHDQPSKWDGPEDDDFYRVSFLTTGTQRETRIRVDFAPNVAWDRHIHITALVGYNDIEPHSRWFAKGTAPRVLDPFEVVRKPFSLTGG